MSVPPTVTDGMLAGAARSVAQKRQHRGALVQAQPDVAVRLWRLDQGAAQCGQCPWPVAVGVVGEGLQHTDLQHAAVPPGVGRRGVQSLKKTERRSDREGSSGMAAVLGGAVLGEQEARQGQVLVLAQVVGVVIGGDASVLGPSGRRRQVPSGDSEAGLHRGDGAEVGVEAAPVQRLGLVEQVGRCFVVAAARSHLGHGHEPPVPVLGD